MFDGLSYRIKRMLDRCVFIITDDYIIADRPKDIDRSFYYKPEVTIPGDSEGKKIKPFSKGYIRDYDAARILLSNMLDNYKLFCHIKVNYRSFVIFPKGNLEDYQFLKEVFESKGFKNIGISFPELEIRRIGRTALDKDEKAEFIKTVLSGKHEDDYPLLWEYLNEEILSATEMYKRGVACKCGGTEIVEFEYDIHTGPLSGGGGWISVCPKCNKQQRHKRGHLH